jgi:hypothetical protein
MGLPDRRDGWRKVRATFGHGGDARRHQLRQKLAVAVAVDEIANDGK